MNLRESIRKDLSLFENESSLIFIIDRIELIDWFFSRSWEQLDDLSTLEQDLSRNIEEQLLNTGSVHIDMSMNDFMSYISLVPIELIKNITQIQREYPEQYKEILDDEGLEVDDNNRHRLDIRG